MKTHLTRREFLSLIGATGVSLGLFDSFLSSFVKGQISSAMAAEAGLKPRRHVFVSSFGAPERWGFDLILNPNNEALIPNPQVVNRYSGGTTYTSAEYVTAKVKGLNFPYLWSLNGAAVSGAFPLANLLDNTIFLRGIYTNNAHQLAYENHTLPPGEKASLGGGVADGLGLPLPSIELNAAYLGYLSPQKSSLIHASATDSLKQLLQPFSRPTVGTTFEQNRQLVSDKIDAALAVVDQTLNKNAPGIIKDRKNSEELIRQSFGDLSAIWTSLVAKYNGIITSAIASLKPGINDKPIGVSGTRDMTYQLGTQGVAATHADMRSLFGPNSGMTLMAESFALTEFMLLKGLSGSIAFNASGYARLLSPTGSNFGFGHDFHFFGKMVTPLLEANYFISLASCLNELIQQLKAAPVGSGTLFDETVLHIGSEFNRAPKKDGSGSDHGGPASSATLISGCIQGPLVVGNVLSQAPSNNNSRTDYPGSWGWAADLTQFGRYAGPQDLYASVSHLLRIPEGIRGSRMIEIKNGKVESVIGPALVINPDTKEPL